ncbi:MAG: hypothetical protein RLZZ292_2685 [Bacteroidota bacterium]|jgi:hypothetical protein
MKNIEKINHYSFEEVLDGFNIRPVKKCKTLEDWMNAPASLIKPAHESMLEDLPEEYNDNHIGWNEEELKMNIISIIFKVANVNERDSVKTFYERRLSGNVENKKISVIVDCMIASHTNSGKPKTPYFFMQEFKRSKGDSHDPEGQMLAAMVLAQELNKVDKPLYGCWVQGKTWNFTTLVGKEYCVSRLYDATNIDDLHRIVFILRKLKDFTLTK